MTRYLLSIYQPDGPVPSEDRLAEIHRDLDALNVELKAAGGWSSTAACIRRAPPRCCGPVRAMGPRARC